MTWTIWSSSPAKSRRIAARDSPLERLATAYLAEHLDFEDILVRFDVVSMLTVGESRALLPFTS